MRHFAHWLVTGFVGLALLGSALLAQPAQAQSRALGLSAVTIELWPEYDRPTVLVQISGTLEPGVALPVAVVVRLPAASGGPLAVATRTAAGALINAPYTTTVSGDQILVTLQADTADFHVEYYDPALATTGAARAYTFRWTADYAVAATAVRVQAPVDSSQLTADPALTPAGLGDDGLNYYTASLGSLAAGQEVSLRLSYSKSTSTLSSEKLPASPAQTAPGPTLTFASPWLWGGVAAGLLVFGAAVWAFWWLRTSQRETPRRPSRRRRPIRPAVGGAQRSGAAEPSAPSRAATGFCTQCGQRLLADDRFCRSCGAPVRE